MRRYYWRLIFQFIISFIVSYLIVGYYINITYKRIDWIAGATIWDKFREYYIRTYTANLIPAIVLAMLLIIIFNLLRRIAGVFDNYK